MSVDVVPLLTIVSPEFAPIITRHEFNGDSYEMEFYGVPGKAYLIEISFDMKNWVGLETLNTDAEGKAIFSELLSALPERVFFHILGAPLP